MILLCMALGAGAAILIDGSFTNALEVSLDSNSISHNGPYDQTDVGWVRSTIEPGNNYTYDTVTGTLRWGPSGSVYGTSTTSFGQALGQINTDNKATTGEISFDFVIDALDLNGGSETLSMAIEVLYWNGTDQTANNKIDLLNGNPADSWWTSLGFVQTATITGAGTYTTGTVDLGSGYDVVAVRYVPLDNGTAGWMDYVTVSSISVNSTVPEPATIGMLGFGMLVTLGIRRFRG
jgi:hypothetical protein